MNKNEITLKVYTLDRHEMYLSQGVANFEEGGVPGEMVIEGPYMTVKFKGERKSIHLQDLAEALLEVMEEEDGNKNA